MNRKTIYVLFGLLIIALAAVGIGYGLWFEDLKIHGEVETGDLDIDFSGPYVDAYFSDEEMNYLCDEAGCPEKFDTVTCDAGFIAENQDQQPQSGTSDGDPDRLDIWVTGAYPSFTCEVEFDIESNGSVPVHLAFWMDPLSDWDPGLVCAWEQTYASPFDVVGVDGILYDGADPVQLHQGERIWCKALVHFTNYDGIGEDDSFWFQYHFRGFQWNESPFPVVEP